MRSIATRSVVDPVLRPDPPNSQFDGRQGGEIYVICAIVSRCILKKATTRGCGTRSSGEGGSAKAASTCGLT